MVIRILIGMFVVFILENCATLDKKETDFYDIEIEQFSSSIQLLLSNQDFLKKEVLKVNAKKPSIQRILSQADLYFKPIKFRWVMASSYLNCSISI